MLPQTLPELAALLRPKPDSLATHPPITFQLLDIYEGTVQSYYHKNDELIFAHDILQTEDLTSDGFYHEIELDDYVKKPPYKSEQEFLVLFGCDARGMSVCCQVRYYPYLYLRTPDNWTPNHYDKCVLGLGLDAKRISYEVEKRCSLAGWESDPLEPTKRKLNTYLKIRFHCLGDLSMAHHRLKHQYVTAEDQIMVPSWLKFLDEQNLVPGGWVTVEQYLVRPKHGYCSTCQIEIQAQVYSVVKPPVPALQHMAPLLMLSVDGEMRSAKRKFPDEANEGDAIIGIGLSVQRYGSPTITSVYLALQSPGMTEPFPVFADPEKRSHYVATFKTEADLLLAYRDFLILVDPDVVTGYNTHRFDWRYFFRRATFLGLDATRFMYQGRLAAKRTPLEEIKMESAAFGENLEYEIKNFWGRWDIDMMINIIRNPNFKLRSYKLSAVSQHFLKDDKIDLDAQAMFRAFDEEGNEGCEKIGRYCVQDTILPLRLMEHTLVLPNVVEMARLSSSLPQKIISGGQVRKISNCFFREAHLNGFVFNGFTDTKVPEYVGATVIEPLVGFYDDYVVVLDFASLYPSILIDYNLSHDTLILPETEVPLNQVPHRVIPGSGDMFVTHEEGLLPRMEKKLLQSRRDVKKQMKVDPDNTMLDAKQACIKVVCNSVYGYTSTATNRMNCPAVGRTITHYGRQMIQTTKRLIEETYKATVIYGDTDSVFIRFHAVESLEEAFRLGHEAAAMVTKHFGGEYIELTMEKTFRPFLLLAKKRYSGLKYDSPQGPGKIANKGLDNVRRDSPLFVNETYTKILDALIYKKDMLLAQKVLFDQLCLLEDGLIDPEKFEISVKLRSTYANRNLPQVAVMEKMKARNPGSEPSPGERFSYTLVDVGRDTAKVFEKAEDPAYVREHNLAIDFVTFLRRLETAVSKLFEPFTDNPAIMFERIQRVMKSRQIRNKSLLGHTDHSPSPPLDRVMPVLPPKKRPMVIKRLVDISTNAPLLQPPKKAKVASTTTTKSLLSLFNKS